MHVCATVYIVTTLVAHRLYKYLFAIMLYTNIKSANKRGYEKFLFGNRNYEEINRRKFIRMNTFAMINKHIRRIYSVNLHLNAFKYSVSFLFPLAFKLKQQDLFYD